MVLNTTVISAVSILSFRIFVGDKPCLFKNKPFLSSVIVLPHPFHPTGVPESPKHNSERPRSIKLTTRRVLVVELVILDSPLKNDNNAIPKRPSYF